MSVDMCISRTLQHVTKDLAHEDMRFALKIKQENQFYARMLVSDKIIDL